ncbi:M24 family metallopeptidase [Aeromicrobium sp. CF3.5]|uniref:M24 family metallopeptidase n=1 Tax=Aeromicrobium sp. CF3.5 TaxID=3373078 RepID=UPI003EE65E2D
MSAERRQRLVTELAARGVAGLLVTTAENVRYLSGFSGSNGALLVPADGDAVLFTDGRYRDQAAAEAPDLLVEVGRDLLGGAARRMRSDGPWALETHTLSVDDHRQLSELASVPLVPGARLVEGLREIKDDREIESLRTACAISTDALTWLLDQPLTGLTERQIARRLEFRMLETGAEAIAFSTIVAAGENTAIPHHQPTDRPLDLGDLLKVDFGARVDGYHADCTRTMVVGSADAWQRDVHAAVRDSQAAGVRACTDGTTLAEIDRVSRSSLDVAGWLDRFTTGLGHGVGLLIHEDPFISAAHAGRLAPRTVLTVEPGIYVPGRGGVRIEDTVLVTSAPGQPDVLTQMTTDLLEIS